MNKVMFVVSEWGSCCSSRPIRVFQTFESAHNWISKQADPNDYDWNEVEVDNEEA